MKQKLTMILFLSFFISNKYFSQGDESWKVYDDSGVAVLNITMDTTDVKYMYENPHSDSIHLAAIHFKNAFIDETVDSVGIRIRGNTSRDAYKKSFKLSFNSFIKGRKFYSLEKLNINGEHNDPSIIRSKLCWDIFNKIGKISSRAAHCAVYINGKNYGLYISVEHVDENFVKKNFTDDSGNLWKCLYGADLTKENLEYEGAYTLKKDNEGNGFAELDTLVNIIDNTTITTFENNIEKYLDVEEYLKNQAVDIITGSWDDYSVLSNNYYLYHDPSTDIFHFIPYDYDNTFGIDWLSHDWANENLYTFGNIFGQPRPLINRLLTIPKYRNLLSHFVEFYLNTYMKPEIFNAHMDSIKSLIDPYAISDDYKMLDWGFTNSDYQQSFNADIFTIDPHVKYSIEKYNSLRKSSLLSQISYEETNPIIYRVNISNTRPNADETIKLNTSVFSNNSIHSIVAQLTFNDSTSENVPLNFSPVENSYKVEENDNWETEIPALGKGKKINLKIIVQDNSGKINSYPTDGIKIYTPGSVTKEVVISELMSLNSTTIQDNAGEYDDWLEIYNPQDSAVDLSFKYLTDKKDNLTKWQFPENVKIQPNQYVIIWCDEDQEQAGPHVNFKLSSDGEFAAIVDNDGVTIVDSVSFPAMNEDESYARENLTGDWYLTSSPTPGESNIPTDVELRQNDNYSLKLNAYPNPFNPVTTIEYSVPNLNAKNENKLPIVQLKIYDVLGREITTLIDEKQKPGNYKVIWNADEFSSGIYFAILKSSSYSKTLKIILLR